MSDWQVAYNTMWVLGMISYSIISSFATWAESLDCLKLSFFHYKVEALILQNLTRLENYRRVASGFWQVDKPPPTKGKESHELENKIIKTLRLPGGLMTTLRQVSGKISCSNGKTWKQLFISSPHIYFEALISLPAPQLKKPKTLLVYWGNIQKAKMSFWGK